MKNKLFISLISFVLVFAIIFTFPLTAFADTVTNPDGSTTHTNIFGRQWLFDYGVLSSLDAQYNLYMPIADTNNVYYYRCDPYNNIVTLTPNTGSFTVANWGRGTLVGGSDPYYYYSKRIGFTTTYNNELYLYNEHTIKNFMVIPKNTSVRISFIVHLTGTVTGWNEAFLENIDFSLYTNQLYNASDKYAEYITNVENSIWFVGSDSVGVNEGTPCSRFIISKTITAYNDDVHINSIHFNLNRIRWGGDIALQYNGTMFMSGLVVDFLKPTTDPSFEKETLSFWDRIINTITGIPTAIGQFFSNLSTWLSNGFTNVTDWLYDIWRDLGFWFDDLTTDVGKFFSSLGRQITDEFDGLISMLAWPFHSWLDPIFNIVSTAVDGFIDLARGIFNLSTVSANYLNGVE